MNDKNSDYFAHLYQGSLNTGLSVLPLHYVIDTCANSLKSFLSAVALLTYLNKCGPFGAISTFSLTLLLQYSIIDYIVFLLCLCFDGLVLVLQV